MHIDTNILIMLFAGDPAAVRFFQNQLAAQTNIVISAVTWFEYCRGSDLNSIKMFETLVSPTINAFTEKEAILAAKLYQNTGKVSKHAFDCMIAAAAIFHNSPLATFNTKDFQKFIPFGLKLESISA